MTRDNNLPQAIIARMLKTYLSTQSEPYNARLGAEILGATHALTQLGAQHLTYAREIDSLVKTLTPIKVPHDAPIPRELRDPYNRGYQRIQSTSLDMYLHKV